MKKNKLTKEQTKKIWFLYEWNMVITEYIEYLESEFDIDWREDFEEPRMTKSDLKGWQMAYNDSFEMVQGLLPDQYKTLDKILKDKFGEGLFEADKKHVKRINKIVEKGKIKTEVQYYLLREYFERIWDMIEYKNTAGKIEKMLYVFENKIKK